MRLRKRPGQAWVAWCSESGVNYPLLDDEAFMAQFDLHLSYRQSADIWAPYLPGAEAWRAAMSKDLPEKTERNPVAMFVSARSDRSARLQRIAELAENIRIDSYGAVLNNRTLDAPDLGATKMATIARYPFSIAFENAIETDYVTEKLFQPLLAGTIPIYLGAPNVAEFAPPGSFIDAATFPSMRALAAYILHLGANAPDRQRYHAWRAQPLPPQLAAKIAIASRDAFDRLIDDWLAAQPNGLHEAHAPELT